MVLIVIASIIVVFAASLYWATRRLASEKR
jgi:hypothetical protein